MSSAVHDRQRTHRASEQAALRRLIERLVERFPELSEDEITRAVYGQYAEFDDSKVRDFVPILVERAVREDLVAAPPRYRA